MTEVLDHIATAIATLPQRGALVAIDGVDGSGKTTFARALHERLSMPASRLVHLDDFVNPPQIRHARGRWSPEGFWLDTYDYARIRAEVLDGPQEADPLVIVEGMFLLRDDLAALWDFSVFLDVPFSETARRMAIRDGTHADPDHVSMRRYVEGQRLYFDAVRPWARASLVVDNSDPVTPRIIRPDECTAAREGCV
jgi:uridine kinase